MWGLAGAYLVIVLSGIACVLFGRGPVLIRGELVFRLTTLFVAAALLGSIIGLTRVRGALVFWAVTLGATLILRSRWLLARYDAQTTPVVLESAMRLLLIPFERTEAGYALKIGTRGGGVRILEIVPTVAVLTFWTHEGPKKMALLRALLTKKFRGVFPPLTIDLR